MRKMGAGGQATFLTDQREERRWLLPLPKLREVKERATVAERVPPDLHRVRKRGVARVDRHREGQLRVVLFEGIE